ncbi:MAG TPA: ABC transporter permease [Deinococcales bacterium]|nr:ABC transporter permease [Deinococcales bacterium]
MESAVLSTLARALAFGTPLLWASLGEILAERSGVVNLGVEGVMALGALAGFAVAHVTGNPWLGLAAASLAGAAGGAIHALVTVVLRANQYVSGLALSMFGVGLAGLLGNPLAGTVLEHPLQDVSIPGLSALLGAQSPMTYLGVLAALILWFVLYRTRAGLVVRSCGENPAAVDVAGSSVTLTRFACVVIGGLLAGAAGGFLSIAYRPSWTDNMTGGLGWIAVAIAIFAVWNPLGGLLGAFLFGGLYHLSFRLQASLPPELLAAMPYLFVIVVLVFSALRTKRSTVPEALGLAYHRGER